MPDDLIHSLHKLTFSPATSPLVILDYGQFIDQELAFSLAKAVEVINPVDATDAFIRDGKSSVWKAQIKTYSTESLDLDARVAAMQSHISIAALGKKPLRVQIQGHSGHYWQFADCMITGHTPVRELLRSKVRWSRTWDIVASGLSYT